jgi:hypothetical protein
MRCTEEAMSAKVHHEYATIALVLVDRSICCAGAFLWFQLFDFVLIHIRHKSIDAMIVNGKSPVGCNPKENRH